MSTVNVSNVTTIENSAVFVPPEIPHTIRFWYFFCCDILSLSCAIVTLYFLLSDRALRNALNNHIFIVLLIVSILYELINIPFFLRNTFYDTPWQAPKEFYLFWTFFDYFFFVLQIELFTWATIERHILIFHEQWLTTRKQRFFIHYLPIVGIFIYNLIIYIIVYYGAPCDHSFDAFLHGGVHVPCAFDQTIWGSLDLCIQQIIPILTIIIASFALIVRVIRQKTRAKQMFRWKQYRKLTIQSISLSIIYITFDAPWVFAIFAYQCGVSIFTLLPILVYAKFVYYNITFCFPFVCYLTLAEHRHKFKLHIPDIRNRRRVGISTFASRPTGGGIINTTNARTLK